MTAGVGAGPLAHRRPGPRSPARLCGLDRAGAGRDGALPAVHDPADPACGAAASTCAQRLGRLVLAAAPGRRRRRPLDRCRTSPASTSRSRSPPTTAPPCSAPTARSRTTGGLIGSWNLRCVRRPDPEGARRPLGRGRRSSGAWPSTTSRDHLGRLPKVVVAREGRTFGFWRPDQMVYANQGEGRPKWASWAGLVTFWVLTPVADRRRGRPAAAPGHARPVRGRAGHGRAGLRRSSTASPGSGCPSTSRSPVLAAVAIAALLSAAGATLRPLTPPQLHSPPRDPEHRLRRSRTPTSSTCPARGRGR